MRHETLSTYHDNRQSEELLTVDEFIRSSKKRAQSYRDVQEDDFLSGITPNILPDQWEEEE